MAIHLVLVTVASSSGSAAPILPGNTNDLESTDTACQPPMGGQNSHGPGQDAVRQRFRPWLIDAPVFGHRIVASIVALASMGGIACFLNCMIVSSCPFAIFYQSRNALYELRRADDPFVGRKAIDGVLRHCFRSGCTSAIEGDRDCKLPCFILRHTNVFMFTISEHFMHQNVKTHTRAI